MSAFLADPTTAAFLIVMSAFLHAAWNALLHRQREPQRATFAVLTLCFILSFCIVTARGESLGRVGGCGWTYVAGLSEWVYFCLLGYVLQRLPVGLGYLLMRGTSMLCVTGLSVLLLGEAMGPIKALGVGALLVGMVLRSRSAPVGSAPTDPRALVAAVLCAAGISGYHMAYGQALAQGIPPLGLFCFSTGIALMGNVIWMGPRWAFGALCSVQRHLGRMVGAASLCLGAFWLFLVCLGSLDAGVAICLRNLSVVFAQGFAWLGREPFSRRAVWAMGWFMVGAALLVTEL